MYGELVISAALAVGDNAPDCQTPYQDPDDERYDPGSNPEVGDAVGHVGDGTVFVSRQVTALGFWGASSDAQRNDRGETE